MLRLRNAPGVRHRSFGRPEGLQPWWFPMFYSFRKLSITSTASEFNLIILNPRNEYNTPSKPSGTNWLLEQPLAMGSERRSAPRSAATAPACKGFPVTQRREHLWRPGALNGINAPHNH